MNTVEILSFLKESAEMYAEAEDLNINISLADGGLIINTETGDFLVSVQKDPEDEDEIR